MCYSGSSGVSQEFSTGLGSPRMQKQPTLSRKDDYSKLN